MEEVEQICSRIMIMDRGRALATGTNSELKDMVGINERIEIELAGAATSEDSRGQTALELVQGLAVVASAKLEDGTLHISCRRGSHNLSLILSTLQSADIAYGRVYSEPPTLNDVFLEITGKELRD